MWMGRAWLFGTARMTQKHAIQGVHTRSPSEPRTSRLVPGPVLAVPPSTWIIHTLCTLLSLSSSALTFLSSSTPHTRSYLTPRCLRVRLASCASRVRLASSTPAPHLACSMTTRQRLSTPTASLSTRTSHRAPALHLRGGGGGRRQTRSSRGGPSA